MIIAVFGRLYVTSFYYSVVSTSASCIVFDIYPHVGQKSRLFTCILASPEFHHNIGHKKTKMMGLLIDESVMIVLAVLVQFTSALDRQTDRPSCYNNYHIYIASCHVLQIKLASIGYSALPSLPRLMRRTHTQRDSMTDAERYNTFSTRCKSMLPLFAAAATINCVNCDKPSDARPWMPPGRWSRLSSPVAWTGATHCTVASLTSWCDVCSRCRTLRPGWSLARDGATTSHRCFASCSGFRCGSASTTRSPSWFIGLCPATSRATWLTTADSLLTPVSDDCVLPTLEHWSSGVAHKALLATDHLLQQHLGSWTVCHLIQDNLTFPVVTLGGHLRHFFLGSS